MEVGYYHFYRTDLNVSNDNPHPHLRKIINDTNNTLKLDITGKTCWSNYWMCTPAAMHRFIPWVTDILIPTVKSHELCMADAIYKESMSQIECLEKWGLPYYPHLCFVIERLIPCYFETNIKLLKEDKGSITG
jgi:hypothetical protein